MAEPIGRRHEQESLLDVLARAESGDCTVAHLVGDAGMGKSTLMDAVRDDAARRGHVTLGGGLTAAETGLSWAGLATLVRRVPVDMLERLPVGQARAVSAALGTGDGSADALLVAAGLTSLVTALAETATVTVLIDDLHWLDPATAGALSFAVRSLEHTRVAFVFASRPVELPLEPTRLVPPERFVGLSLDGLSVAALRALLDDRFGVQLGRIDLIGLHETTGGNPWHAIEAGRLIAAGHSAQAAMLPPSLHAVVAAHLRLLPVEVLPPLRAAALSAAPTIDVLERLFTSAEVRAAVLAAERAEVLDVRGTALRFRHPTLVAGLVEGMGAFERRDLESRLAEVVDNDEERALLSASAATQPSSAIAAAMEQAATDARRRGAMHVATQHASRSWELTPVDDVADRRRRRVLLADLLATAGEPARARAIYDELLAEPYADDAAWEAVTGRTIVVAHLDGESAAGDMVDLLVAAAGDDPTRLARAYAIATRLQLLNGNPDAVGSAARLIELARSGGDVDEILTAEVLSAIVLVIRGEPYDVDGLLDRCVAHWGAESPRPGMLMAEVLVWTDRLDAVDLHLAPALVAAQASGQVIEMMNQLDQMGDAHLRSARWAEAERCYEQYHDINAAAGEIVAAGSRTADIAYMDAIRGRRESARLHLAEASRSTRSATRVELGQIAARRGSSALFLGDPAAAVTHLSEAREHLRAAGVVDVGAMPYLADLAEALVAVGRVADAAAVAADLRTLAARSGRHRARLEAARATALVAAAEGDVETAEAEWERAMQVHDEVALPFERARTLMIGGVLARRSGRRTDARTRLDAARAEFARLGAVTFVERADDELARCGQDVTANSGELTPTERQIAALVANGRTNAEIAATLFISVRTVESNLTKVYRKLGVRSRTGLVGHMAEFPTP